MPAPEVAIGQRARVRILTKSRGPVIVGMNETVELAPDLSQKVVSAVQALDPQSIYNAHGGGTGKISPTETQALELYAALQDMETSPGTTPAGIINDLRNLQPFSMIVEKMPDDKNSPFGFLFAYGCLPSNVAAPMPAMEAMKRDIPFKFKRLDDLRGFGVRYVRCRSTGTLIATPTDPGSLATAAGTTTFAATDIMYVRIASCDEGNSPGDPPPTAASHLTRAAAEQAILVGTATNKIVLTVPAVAAGTSLAVYVGRASGAETFYDWIAAAGTTIDIVEWPDPSGARPPYHNNTLAFATAEDKLFTVGGGLATIDLSVGGALPIPLIPSGLPYVAVLKNGVRQPEDHAVSSGFYFSKDLQTFAVQGTPDQADVWELVLPVAPGA